MVTPFVRVDLSPAARDFDPTVLRAGLPLLDERNSRYPALRRWFGALVAEPERHQNLVSFYLCSPAGARLEQVECAPATEGDLKSSLKREFESLIQCGSQATASNPDEESLLTAVRRELASLQDPAQRQLRSSSLFKYRDHSRQWRLVWCPGYHRKDPDPTLPTICSNPECRALYVRRGGNRECPVCAAAVSSSETDGASSGSKHRALAVMVVALVVAAATMWYRYEHEDSGNGRPNATKVTTKPGPKSDGKLHVEPETLTLNYGEVAQLKIDAPPSDLPLQIVSSDPNTVEPLGGHRLAGLREGTSLVEVIQGKDVASVHVTVTSAPYVSLRFVPYKTTVHAGETAKVQVQGSTQKRKDIEILDTLLDWIVRPDPATAELESSPLRVHGLKPTGSEPATFSARFAGQEAHAWVEILPAEVQLKLAADGPTKIPAGQTLPLKVTAISQGKRTNLTAQQVEFQAAPVEGLVLRGGVVNAVKASAGPLKITASYGGATSNELSVTSVASVPLTLKAKADPDKLKVGGSGVVDLSATNQSKPVSLSLIGAGFKSSDPDVVAVDAETGVFEGRKAGTVTLTATHPSAKEPATCSVTVAASDSSSTPKSLHIVSGNIKQPIKLPVGASFQKFRVESEDGDGTRHDVTDQASLQVAGESGQASVAVRDGKIAAVKPGEAKVTAELGGLKSAESLAFDVSEKADVDEIRLSPGSVSVSVGEAPKLTATGYKNDQPTGDITSLSDLEWEVKADGATKPITGKGPAFHWSPRQSGDAEVTVRLGKVVSNAAKVHVVAKPEQVAEGLTVSPSALQLSVGESRPLSPSIKVMRGTQDVTDRVQVSPAATDIVSFDGQTRSLVGKNPGKTRVTFSDSGKLAALDVDVVPAEAPTADSKLEIEPASGELHVGERVQLHGFEVCDSCEQPRVERTASLQLVSSSADIVKVDGTSIVGVKPGKATITARLPGIDKPAQAEFTVVDAEFTGLVVEPSQMELNPGERQTFKVYAVGPHRRVLLGEHSDLKVSVGGSNPKCIEYNAAKNEIRGVEAGTAELTFAWRSLPAQRLAVTVAQQALTEIRIFPVQALLAVGQTGDFQVYGRRGGKLSPLTAADGLTLRTARPEIAEVAKGRLQVKGLKPGVTSLIAECQGHRATASVHVVDARTAARERLGRPKSGAVNSHDVVEHPAGVTNVDPGNVTEVGPGGVTTVGPGHVTEVGPSGITELHSGGVLDDSPGYFTHYRYGGGTAYDIGRSSHDVVTGVRHPTGLRFSDTSASTVYGTPGHAVHVLRDYNDGHVEDVTDRVKFHTNDPNGVVSVDKVGGDTVIRSNKPGTAEVSASLDGLKTNRPLPVRSVAAKASQAVLHVVPDPMVVQVGQSRSLRRVEVVPASGAAPFAVAAKLTPQTGKFFAVDAGGRSIRGLNPGTGTALVTVTGGPAKYRGLKTTVTVNVFDPTIAASAGGNSPEKPGRLVLDGPHQMTVGETAHFQVEQVGDAQHGRIVTFLARLTSPPSEESLATLLPGARVRAKAPGVLELTASFNGEISNTMAVRIVPRASRFSKLILETKPSSLAPGQAQPFKVYGYPQDGSQRQDLTSAVTDGQAGAASPRLDVSPLQPNAKTKVLQRKGDNVTAVGAGRARVQASLPGGLKSNPVDISVAPAPDNAIVDIRVTPEQVSLPASDKSPASFSVSVRTQGSDEFKEVADAKLESLDTDILAPVTGDPHQFRAVAPGRTQVRGTYGGQSAIANVVVTADRFEKIVLNSPQLQANQFNFDVTVTGGRSGNDQPEYRILTDPKAGSGVAWTPAKVSGATAQVKLTSPYIPLVPNQRSYRVFIQARDHRNPNQVESFPCWVQFNLSRVQ